MAAIWNQPVQTFIIQSFITIHAIKIANTWVGGMTPPVKYLLCKQEGLGLIPEATQKCHARWHPLGIPALGGRQEDPWGSLACGLH